jgi:hypothetical protein
MFGRRAVPAALCPAALSRFLDWGLAVTGWRVGLGVAVTGSGWSGRLGERAGGGFDQGHPLLLAVPAFGQVHGDVAVAGGAGSDVDEVAAQRGTSGLGVGEAGQRPGRTQQVVSEGGAGEPGRVGGE